MTTDAGTRVTHPLERDEAQAGLSRWDLAAGILGRTWIWFVAGCLVVTLAPMLFGWRSFVVQSGSMEPRINVGDVVLAAPDSDPADLLGRVAVFSDPSDPTKTKVHRVVATNADGTLQTKGDANPTPDSMALPLDDVRGMARLLVSYAGLPLIWAQTGQWHWLALFLASLALAGLAISRDQEDDEIDDDDVEADDDSDDSDDADPGAAVVPLPTRLGGAAAAAIAASSPLDKGLRRVLSSPRWMTRTAYIAVLACAVLLPTAGAAFAATTTSPSNAWNAGYWNYTYVVNSMTPWLYWKLDETTGTVATDSSPTGTRSGTYNTSAGAFTRGVVGAVTSSTPNRAATFNGTTACVNTASATTMNAPAQLTEIVWFKTATTAGGKLVGFEMPQNGVAMPGSGGTYDRHLYMDGAGKVWFGVYNGGYFTIGSSGAYNDNTWHMAAATMGAGGMALYLDGVLVGSNANTAGETTTGWFRAGCGNLGGWGASWTGPNSPSTSTSPTQNRPFAGTLDEISIWQSALSAAQIQTFWSAR